MKLYSGNYDARLPFSTLARAQPLAGRLDSVESAQMSVGRNEPGSRGSAPDLGGVGNARRHHRKLCDRHRIARGRVWTYRLFIRTGLPIREFLYN